MKMFSRLLTGIVVFTLVFTFMPTGTSGSEVVNSFVATKSYSGSIHSTSTQLVASYVSSSLNADTNVVLRDIGDRIGDVNKHLYEMCEPSDMYAEGEFLDGVHVTSHYGVNRNISSGTHGGTDMTPENRLQHSKVMWTLALFSGTIVKAEYNYSYGWHVIQTVDNVPGLYVLYAHMANGRGGYSETKNGATSYYRSAVPPSWQQTSNFANKATNGYTHEWGDSSLQVSVGDHIGAGTRLGLLGTTGSSTGLHSHVELRLYLNSTGDAPLVFDGAPTTQVSYRTDVSMWLNGEVEFSGLEWVYWDGTKAVWDTKLLPSDLAEMNSVMDDIMSTYGGGDDETE